MTKDQKHRHSNHFNFFAPDQRISSFSVICYGFNIPFAILLTVIIAEKNELGLSLTKVFLHVNCGFKNPIIQNVTVFVKALEFRQIYRIHLYMYSVHVFPLNNFVSGFYRLLYHNELL